MAAIAERGNGAQTSFTRGLQAVARLMSHHGKGKKPCLCCDLESLPCSILDHELAEHNVCTASSDDVN